MTAPVSRLEALGLSPQEPGKGKNLWSCIGDLIACADSSVMAILDCDTLTGDSEMLARLIHPVANPNFPYQMSKGFYPRLDDKTLNGRVTRLLVSPLLIALEKVAGDHDFLDFLRSVRYPPSGEFALRTPSLPDRRIPSDWGLEIGVLSEGRRTLALHSVCRVEIVDTHDHKHQDLLPEDANKGLSRMSTAICKAIVRKLAADGTVFTPNMFRTLKATSYRLALDLPESCSNDVRMNGLTVDRHKEERSAELFAETIIRAGQIFLEHANESPFIPTRNRVHATDPRFLCDLCRAVAEDAAEFS
ncbi:MAG: hypothetical protein Kow0013_28950 [Pararhodobacter sp.]